MSPTGQIAVLLAAGVAIGARALGRRILSSLEVAEAALVALCTGRDTAASQVRRFRVHDEETLRAQAAIKDDETWLIATARASARQLENLFESDAR